jgi:hypothetical protein
MLELSAASTTPEKSRILPDACSETVMVLMARMRSGGGGGASRQAETVARREAPKIADNKDLQNGFRISFISPI